MMAVPRHIALPTTTTLRTRSSCTATHEAILSRTRCEKE
jgi:hypothetical protein